MTDHDWRDDVIAAANAAGLNVSHDVADAVLMAENRNLCPRGSIYDKLAESLAGDLATKAPEPITRAMCATLARAAANVNGLTLLGYDARECLAILSFAAAKLEMRAKP